MSNRLGESLTRSLKNRFVAGAVVRELTVLYYFFTFSKQECKKDGAYSYHRKVGYSNLFIVLLILILMESAGMFFLLHNWNQTVSWIHAGMKFFEKRR